MQKNNKKKICIVVSSLGKGGAEKSSALLSIMLFNLGYNVHIISILNNIDYPYKGKLLNLGILKDKDNSILGRLKRFKVFLNYLKSERFNLIIDSRSRPTIFKQFLINKILYRNEKVNFIVHSSKLESYFPKQKMIASYLYKNANKIITVSNGIKNNLEIKYGFKNITTIYNAVNLNSSNSVFLNKERNNLGDYILFYGRLVDAVKNITLLINSYKISQLHNKKIKLIILGDGVDKTRLNKLVNTLKLEENVKFLPYINNPLPLVKAAFFTVLTSRYEGFPNVLIESLSVGTPVVSVNCKTGPSEVIIDRHNGLLVENYNSGILASAFNEFIFNKNLYNICKENSKTSIDKFSMKTISKLWIKVIENS